MEKRPLERKIQVKDLPCPFHKSVHDHTKEGIHDECIKVGSCQNPATCSEFAFCPTNSKEGRVCRKELEKIREYKESLSKIIEKLDGEEEEIQDKLKKMRVSRVCEHHRSVHTDFKTGHGGCKGHGHCLNPVQCPLFAFCPLNLEIEKQKEKERENKKKREKEREMRLVDR